MQSLYLCDIYLIQITDYDEILTTEVINFPLLSDMEISMP